MPASTEPSQTLTRTANKSVVATADNAASSLRSRRLNPAGATTLNVRLKMKTIIAILAISTLSLSCSESKNKSHDEFVFEAEYTRVNDDLVISLRVKNNTPSVVNLTTFHKGRFEPLTIISEDQVIAKQGGWDLIKVDPVKLNIDITLKQSDEKSSKVVCVMKDKLLKDSSILLADLTYYSKNKWRKVVIPIQPQN